MPVVTVRNLVRKFDWTVITGNDNALKREIDDAETNRPGLELAGYFPKKQTRRLIILGDKELTFINENMDEVSQRRAFEWLTSPKTPGIIVTNGMPCPPILEEIGRRKNFPIFSSTSKTGHVIVSVTNYLDEMLAKSIIIHGELVQVYGVGVLITGQSGMGKSEIVLELVRRGHQLVADDRVDVFHIHNQLIGKPSGMIAGFMELRGIGIIDVKRMYGVSSIADSCDIDFIVHLEKFSETTDYDRVGIEEKEYDEILGVKVLKMRIPVSYGRPMSTIIETAVTNYLLLKEGFDSAKEFEERVLQEIAHNQEEEEEE
jgi:HPr kinase/phosphorylase